MKESWRSIAMCNSDEGIANWECEIFVIVYSDKSLYAIATTYDALLLFLAMKDERMQRWRKCIAICYSDIIGWEFIFCIIVIGDRSL